MSISKPILEQTLPEYKKQMSVNGKAFLPLNHCSAFYSRYPI